MNTGNSTPRDNATPTRPTYTRDQGQYLADTYRSLPHAGYLALDPNSKDGKLPLGEKPDTVVPGRKHTSNDAHVTVDELPDYVAAGYGMGVVAGYDANKGKYLVIVDADNWEDMNAFATWYQSRNPGGGKPVVSVNTPGRTASQTHSGGAHYYLIVDAADWPDPGPTTATMTENGVGAANHVLGTVRLGWGVKFGSSYACMPSTQRVVNGQWRDYMPNTDDDGRVLVTKAYEGFVQDLLDYNDNPTTRKIDDLGDVVEPNSDDFDPLYDDTATAVLRRLVSGEVTREDHDNCSAFANATHMLATAVFHNRAVKRWNWAHPDDNRPLLDTTGSMLDDEVYADRYEAALRIYAPTMMDAVERDLPSPDRLRKPKTTTRTVTPVGVTSDSDDYDADTLAGLRDLASYATPGGGIDTIQEWEDSDEDSATWDTLFQMLGDYTRVRDARCGCAQFLRDDSDAAHSLVAHDRATCESGRATTQAVVYSTYDDPRYAYLAPRADGGEARDAAGNRLLSKFDVLSMALGGYEEAGRWLDEWFHERNNEQLAGAFAGYTATDPNTPTVVPAAPAPTAPATTTPATAPATPTPAPATVTPPTPPTAPANADANTTPATVPGAGTADVGTTVAVPTPAPTPAPVATTATSPTPPTPPTPPTLHVVPPLPPTPPATTNTTDDGDDATIDELGDRLAAFSDLVEVADGKVHVRGREGGMPEVLNHDLATRVVDLVDYYADRANRTPDRDLVYTVAKTVNTGALTGKGIGENSPFDPRLIREICNSTPLTRAVATRATRAGVNPVAALYATLARFACRIHPRVTTPDVSHLDHGRRGSTLNLNIMSIGSSGAGKSTAMNRPWPDKRYGFDHACYYDYDLANRGPGVRDTKPGEDTAHLTSLVRKPDDPDPNEEQVPVGGGKFGVVDTTQAVSTKAATNDPLTQPLRYPVWQVEGTLTEPRVGLDWDPDNGGEVGSGDVLADVLGEYVEVDVDSAANVPGVGDGKDKGDGKDTGEAPRRRTETVWRTKERAVFTVEFDEFEAALAKASDKKAALIPHLNTAWAGNRLGNLTRSGGDRRIDGPYRLVRVANAQPQLFPRIREKGDTGMLQREIMVAVEYPWGSCDVGIDPYGEADLLYPCDVLVTEDNPTGAIAGFTFDPDVFAEAYIDEVGRPRHGEDTAAMTHRNLNLIRLSCVLAAAHGVSHVTLPLWDLARHLIDYATRSFYYMRDESKAALYQRTADDADADVVRRASQKQAHDDRVAKVAAGIVEVVRKQAAKDKPATRRDFDRRYSGTDSEAFIDEALRLLTTPPSGAPALVVVPPTGRQTAPRYTLPGTATGTPPTTVVPASS